jgi:hypothetical protein
MDAAVKATADELNKVLVEYKALTITVNQFIYNQNVPPLSNYWINQLTEVLVNMPDRAFSILSTGASGAEWTISGEIVDVADVVRIYTRLANNSDHTIEAAVHSDLERSEYLMEMLYYESPSGRSSSSARRDTWEPDSWENPVLYEIGNNEHVQAMNRTIHEGGEEDFFLLIPETDGRLVVETTGSMDTYMSLYNYDTDELLDENDDGGQSTNARIRYSVEAGVRYLAKVRGYSSSSTGSYGFRAYISPTSEGSSSWSNPIPYEIGFHENFPVVNRAFNDGDDEDYFLLLPDREGRLVMETTGNIDTYMYLYNYDTRELLDENDDGASSYNARIRHFVQTGTRYLAKIRGYSSSSTGSYGFRAYFPGQGLASTDEYEPDDDPGYARWIEIGTPQQHTFHSTDDVDWVKFQVTRPGYYIIRARGVSSTRLDTYIELFDANINPIAEDDDGGANRDSRLYLRLDSGLYFLKVWCLDDEPDQPYNISIVED